jgi:serine/threonine-protein kinase HipA
MMNNCLICLKKISKSRYADYHDKCVVSAFGSIDIVPKLDGTADDFYKEARKEIKGFSLSGVQAKMGLSTRLNGNKGSIVLSYLHSTHILKPCPPGYLNLPTNEHLSQRIMKTLGFEVPECGVLKFSDGSLAYFIKRYDRSGDGIKIHQEDLLAALGIQNSNEDVKYTGSYEFAADAMKNIGGIQLAAEFINRVIAAYLIGNGDYHMKNISLIYPEPDRVTISPVYDFVNTHLYGDTEILCLNLFNEDEDEEGFDDFYGLKRTDFIKLAAIVNIPQQAIDEFVDRIKEKQNELYNLIEASTLDFQQKEQYRSLIEQRIEYLDRN